MFLMLLVLDMKENATGPEQGSAHLIMFKKKKKKNQ